MIGVIGRIATIRDTIRSARSALMVATSFGALVLCYFVLALVLNPTVQTAIGGMI